MTYIMPAEWEEHKGTWIAWPHNKKHWPWRFDPIPAVFGKIVSVLAENEKVFICVNDLEMERNARAILDYSDMSDEKMKNVVFFHIPTDASWIRDHGPIFTRDEAGQLVIEDWIFNCWGAKYPSWDKDDVVPQHVAKALKMPIIQPGIIMEGGAIDVNGKGTLLTTEQCLLNKNRNPHLNRAQIEGYLKDYFGATNVLWLKEGIAGDDTDGHIDDIARFVNPNTVICAIEEYARDPNYEVLRKNFWDLKKMKDQNGNPLNILPIPMPDPVEYEGQRLPASYANFYIANKVVIVPTFQCSKDEKVLKFFRELFPERQIIGIDCMDLVWGLGTLHCSTQQQPV